MTPQFRKELRNYILCVIKKPILMFYARPLIKFFFHKIRILISDRQGAIQPCYLEKLQKGAKGTKGSCRDLDQLINHLLPGQEAVSLKSFDSRLQVIELASQKYVFDQRLDWKKNFSDEEDLAALHRWNWLLKTASEFSDQEALRVWGELLIQDWIKNFISEFRNSVVWDAYNTSERIYNLIFFCEHVRLPMKEVIKQALLIHANWVLNHLEYYGKQNTYNHILNNARALYTYGCYFSSPIHRESAIKIFEHEIPKLITPDGFLQEGSSHYHFLITKWILETAFVAMKFSDDDFMGRHSALISKMVQNCHFFLVFNKKSRCWELPLIGDVSPDFSPEWLKTLPWAPLAKVFYNRDTDFNEPTSLSGWSLIFPGTVDFKEWRDRLSLQPSLSANNLSNFGNPSSGWYRFEVGQFTVIFYLRPENAFDCPGHFHNDLLSICLFREGRPVLVDPGRLNYKNDPESFFNLSTRAHNSVSIDKLDVIPFSSHPSLRHIYGPLYSSPKLCAESKGQSLKIVFINPGFQRHWQEKILHSRTICIQPQDDIVQIEDQFEGKGKHSVEQFFHFAPGFLIRETEQGECLRILDDNNCLEMSYTGFASKDADVKSGFAKECADWYFPAYGKRESVCSIYFKSKVYFPNSQKFVFHWK